MTETPEWLDTSRPNVARVYDYWLDGKDNFAADRELAESMLAIFPGLRELVRANRQFIARAVSWAAGQGIDQFIDAGAGLPTAPSTHESAQAVNPLAKVAYVDNDPVVINHAKALLTGRDGRVSVVRADMRDPAAVFAGCVNLDASEPQCLILAAVLHLMDAESARRVAAGYVSRLPPGSYVIITLARYDDPVLADQIVRMYSAASFFNHSREDAATFFSGLELVEPGLVSGRAWRGGMPDPGLPDGAVYPLVGVARKPLPANVRRVPGRARGRRPARAGDGFDLIVCDLSTHSAAAPHAPTPMRPARYPPNARARYASCMRDKCRISDNRVLNSEADPAALHDHEDSAAYSMFYLHERKIPHDHVARVSDRMPQMRYGRHVLYGRQIVGFPETSRFGDRSACFHGVARQFREGSH